MKKAKVILTAITVLAVVSGALAFKAQKFNGNLYCGAEGQACDRDGTNLIRYTITNSGGTTLFCTSLASGDDCEHGIEKFVTTSN